MDRIELIRLEKTITDDGGRNPKLMAQALQALADESSQVDARRLAKMLGVFGEALMPAAIEMLAHKKGSERQKALELFAAIADPETIPRLEEARARDRSKKLHREYDYAIRRIRAAAAEKARVKVDPTDSTIDPVARLVELANMDLDDFEALEGIDGGWNRHYALTWLDFDRDGRRAFTANGETWNFVFDDEGLSVETPDGKRTESMPASAGDAAKTQHKELKKALTEATKKRHERLEEALVTGQTWPAWLWRLLFVDHPLADRSARELVFEVKDTRRWKSFRVTQERTFADPNDTSVDVADDASVRLAHPADLEADALQGWRELAERDGWTPPFPQLDRPVSTATKDADLEDVIAGLEVPYARTLAGRLVKLGFKPGEVDEHGMIAERVRTLGGGFFLRLLHGAMPVRQAMIDKELQTPIHRARFERRGTPVGATTPPPRAYSEGVVLLRKLTEPA